MRRDYVTLDVRDIDEDGTERPAVVLTFEGPTELLDDRLTDADGRLDRERVDVAFRLQTPVDDDEATGVFSLANRVTGEFVLEVNADAGPVLDLVSAVRKGADPDDADGRYRIVVREGTADGEDDPEGGAAEVVYEKRTLLVYDEEGSLLRQHSLIPSGVEL
jgi:hypothetical protein